MTGHGLANLNGIDINYRVEGDGSEVVLLINGLADTLETWEAQVGALLEKGFRVVRFDNRGVGQSSKPPGPYTTSLLARDTKALVDHLELKKFHLLGVSMGGMIAQEYALSYGEDLKSATFACTYASPGPFCSRMFAMWADMAPILGVPFVMRDVTLWAFTNSFFTEREAELREFESEMSTLDQPVHAYLAQLNSIRDHDLRSRIAKVDIPTLIMAGEDDILIPVSLSKELHELIPDSKFVTTPGGHGALWEYPREFNEEFISFISSI